MTEKEILIAEKEWLINNYATYLDEELGIADGTSIEGFKAVIKQNLKNAMKNNSIKVNRNRK